MAGELGHGSTPRRRAPARRSAWPRRPASPPSTSAVSGDRPDQRRASTVAEPNAQTDPSRPEPPRRLRTSITRPLHGRVLQQWPGCTRAWATSRPSSSSRATTPTSVESCNLIGGDGKPGVQTSHRSARLTRLGPSDHRPVHLVQQSPGRLRRSGARAGSVPSMRGTQRATETGPQGRGIRCRREPRTRPASRCQARQQNHGPTGKRLHGRESRCTVRRTATSRGGARVETHRATIR